MYTPLDTYLMMMEFFLLVTEQSLCRLVGGATQEGLTKWWQVFVSQVVSVDR